MKGGFNAGGPLEPEGIGVMLLLVVLKNGAGFADGFVDVMGKLFLHFKQQGVGWLGL